MAREEIHPYNCKKIGEIPTETRLLIVGTAPPPRFSFPRDTSKFPLHRGDVDCRIYYEEGKIELVLLIA